MAEEEEEERGFMDQIRRAMGGGGRVSLVPLIVGMVGPAAGERIVLVNPQTQGMVVVQGDAGMISAILAGAGRDGPPPASRASIAALKTVDLGRPEPSTAAEEEEEGEECAICLDGLGTEGEGEGAAAVVKEMPCKHRFHGGCMEKWLGMHGSCPVCRYRMPAEEGEEAKKRGGGGEEGGERREVWFTIAVGRIAEREEEEEERGGDGDGDN